MIRLVRRLLRGVARPRVIVAGTTSAMLAVALVLGSVGFSQYDSARAEALSLRDTVKNE